MSKKCFEGLLYSAKPDMDPLYGIWELLFIAYNSYAGWTDEQGMPTTAWYDNVAAGYTNARGHLLLDHEAWPITTSQERQTNASRFVTIYQELKQRRPDLKIGFYGYTPVRDFFRATKAPEHADYLAWQAENNDFTAMYSVVDFFAPTIYFFYTRSQGNPNALNVPYAHDYFVSNINECKRLRASHGHGQPIYPYVWARRYDGAAYLDLDVWEDMCRTAYTEADGMILWGGYQEAWDASATWWGRFLKDFPYGDRTLLKPRSARN